MLISGGDVLKNLKQKLFGLSAGIEESPIYLIDLKTVKSIAIQQNQPILQHILQQQHAQYTNYLNDLSKDIDCAIKLEPSYNTLTHRTQLATRVYENDFKLNQLCEQIYTEQFWQYQGFLALIANLDDLITSIEKLYEKINENYSQFNTNKAKNLAFLNEYE